MESRVEQLQDWSLSGKFITKTLRHSALTFVFPTGESVRIDGNRLCRLIHLCVEKRYQ
jgi:RNase P/RNase MRP subunit p29